VGGGLNTIWYIPAPPNQRPSNQLANGFHFRQFTDLGVRIKIDFDFWFLKIWLSMKPTSIRKILNIVV
jgi:hypothetical protein